MISEKQCRYNVSELLEKINNSSNEIENLNLVQNLQTILENFIEILSKNKIDKFIFKEKMNYFLYYKRNYL